MGLMDDLAAGLRGAAGVLNPEVQRETFMADERSRNLAAQRQQLMLSHIQTQVASGALSPEEGKAALARIGVPPELAGGPSIDAQVKKQALENEIGYRKDIADLGPNPSPLQVAGVASKRGKPELAIQLYKGEEDRKARLQMAADALDQKAAQAQMTYELTLGRLQNDADKAAETKRYHDLQAGLTAQGNAIKAQMAGIQADMLRHRMDEADRTRGDRKVSQLGTAIEKAGIPQLDSVVRDAEGAITDESVIPYISGAKAWMPDITVGKKVTDARQAITKLFNITLKDRSGAAVTNQELERLKQEFGTGVFKTSDQLKTAIGRARKIVEDHYRGVVAGYGPDALKQYNENLREVGGTPLLEPNRGDVITIKNDAEFDALPSGTRFRAPDGTERRKP